MEISYGPEPQQSLDLYLPDCPEGAPLVVFVHGGAWTVGDKAQYAPVGMRMASEGIIAALVNHRLSPAVQHPMHAQDVARAIAWSYRYAAPEGPAPRRLYLVGHSSGAYLVSLVALDATYLAAEGLDPSIIRGVVGIAGAVYDLDAKYDSTIVAPFVRSVFGADSSRWAQAAPLQYVHPSAPPFLLLHGLQDTETPPVGTERFADALRRAGVPTQLHLLPDEGHISVVFAAAPLLLPFLQVRCIAAAPETPTDYPIG